jgi:hypothetical protein
VGKSFVFGGGSDVRVVDIEAGGAGNHLPSCVGGRGTAPPEFLRWLHRLLAEAQTTAHGCGYVRSGLSRGGIEMLAQAARRNRADLG